VQYFSFAVKLCRVQSIHLQLSHYVMTIRGTNPSKDLHDRSALIHYLVCHSIFNARRHEARSTNNTASAVCRKLAASEGATIVYNYMQYLMIRPKSPNPNHTSLPGYYIAARKYSKKSRFRVQYLTQESSTWPKTTWEN